MADAVLGYLLAGIALLLFATGILLAKAASNRMPLNLGFLIATTTNVVFAALALAVQLGMRQQALQWNTPAFLQFVLAGVFATYLGRWFFYESVVRFGPARASAFQISSPLFTALMAWLLLGERLTLLLLGGMVITVLGLMLVSYKPGFFSRTRAAESEPAAARRSLGQRLARSMFILGMGSSLAYAVGNLLRGTGVRNWDEPVLGALLGATSGLVLHLLVSSGKRELLAGLRTADRQGARLYALMGVTSISAQVCAIASMRYIPLSIATLVTLCTPVLVFPLSHLLFKNSDGVTGITLLGCGLTLLGIFIIVMR